MMVPYDVKAFMRTFLLTTPEAAKTWRVSVRTVFLWRRNSRICAPLARLIARLCAPRAPERPHGWHAGQRIEREPTGADLARWVLGPTWADKLARRGFLVYRRPYGRADLDAERQRLQEPTHEASALVTRLAAWPAPILHLAWR